MFQLVNEVCGASPPARIGQPNGDLKGSRDGGVAPTAWRRGVAATVAGNGINDLILVTHRNILVYPR